MGEEDSSEPVWQTEGRPGYPVVGAVQHSSSTRPSMDNETHSNEQSPLLRETDLQDEPSPLKIAQDGDDDEWQDEDSQESKSSWYMLLLTIGGFG
jgi:hypothetical protein